jgi:hypothetical protein
MGQGGSRWGHACPYCRRQGRASRSRATHPGSGDGSLAGGGALGEIKIEIHRAQAVFQISWPAAESASCARWLREVLR